MQSFTNRIDEGEKKISEPKDKMEDLEQFSKDKIKVIKTYMWEFQDSWDIMKRPSLKVRGIGEKFYFKDTQNFSK